jgi:Tfp pilus assembly protein PilX
MIHLFINKNKRQGFTLFVGLIIASSLLLIATGVVNLALKQALISNSGKESQLAFYAADTGMECAIYWDIANPSGVSAFSIETGTLDIECNKDGNNPNNHWTVGGSSVSTVGPITFLPEPYCAMVTITKDGEITRIESKGYNTCDLTNPRRVERAVRAQY